MVDDRLDEALSRLEGMLEQHDVVPEEEQGSASDALDASRLEPEPLPLLDEVVIPGDDFLDESPGEVTTGASAPMQTPPAYTDLLSRLASELDIVIESCVDEALEQARQHLVAKIKNHLEIVLPEILDEMSRRQSDDD